MTRVPSKSPSRRRRAAHWARNLAPLTVAGTLAGVVGLLGIGAAFASRKVAQMVVTLSGRDITTCTVLAVNENWVLLSRTRNSAAPGTMALVQGDRFQPRSYLHVGEEVTDRGWESVFIEAELDGLNERRLQARSVSRPVLRPVLPAAAVAGSRSTLPRQAVLGAARIASYYWGVDPRQVLGLDYTDVTIPTPGPALPAWRIDPERPRPGAATWVVLVHGRGATRAECLRAVPTLIDLGLTCLIVTYRNANDAPHADDTKCHLGADEWIDTDAAVHYALQHGAEEIVLYGVSMGGQIVLRTAALGRYGSRVRAIVLDAPAIDWPEILNFTGQQLGIPRPIRHVAVALLSNAKYAKYASLNRAIPLHEMTVDAVRRSLHQPTLILHSTADDVVPFSGSARLAQRKSDLVRLETFHRALHTHEWNVDRTRWERLVREFLERHLR
ncbi:alpha/beta fold hydrolase [Micrococcales bacterium 31B]|nr:alpha/beta fold hydrolase [Micrococcales bacterium 31B]